MKNKISIDDIISGLVDEIIDSKKESGCKDIGDGLQE